MKISLIGLGWFGLQLAESLKNKHHINGTNRTDEKVAKLKDLGFDTERLCPPMLPSTSLLNADVILINLPPFAHQLSWLKTWPWRKESRLIFISSTSVYGSNIGEVSESTKPLPNSPSAHWLLEEEEWFKTFPNSTIIRFGGLIGPNRHPGKILSGRKDLEGGNWPVNLIHSLDAVGFVELVIENTIVNETFNLVYPSHPTRQEYYQSYCLANQLALPEFLPSTETGKVVTSHKVMELYEFKKDI